MKGPAIHAAMLSPNAKLSDYAASRKLTVSKSRSCAPMSCLSCLAPTTRTPVTATNSSPTVSAPLAATVGKNVVGLQVSGAQVTYRRASGTKRGSCPTTLPPVTHTWLLRCRLQQVRLLAHLAQGQGRSPQKRCRAVDRGPPDSRPYHLK